MLKHLNWLLLLGRSSGSNLSLSWMTKLLTRSLRKNPATLWRLLISTACICSLILFITTQIRAGHNWLTVLVQCLHHCQHIRLWNSCCTFPLGGLLSSPGVVTWQFSSWKPWSWTWNCCKLEIAIWWSQMNHKVEPLSSVHKNYEENQWQWAPLAQSNTHCR